MDNLVASIPPFLDDKWGRHYLTLAVWAGGWQACYVGPTGLAMGAFYGTGRSLPEAVENLKKDIRLLRLLEAPSGEVEKASRESKKMGEAPSA